MTALAALIRRDIKIALRVGGGALIGMLFFLTVTVLMPFAIGPDLALLTRLGPAILWLGALLASLLTLDRLFTADHEDGSLDLIVMGRAPLELACAAKALAHWLAAGVPLIVATPVLGLLLNLDATATSAVALTLLVGTPALTFTGMIGAALAVTLHRGGLLLAVLVLERRFRSSARSHWSVSSSAPSRRRPACAMAWTDMAWTDDDFDADQLSRRHYETNQAALPAPPLTTIRMP
jgi:heme exporter protein B